MPTPTIEQPTNRTAPKWYAFVSSETEGESEIRIYEDIGGFGVTAKQFADDLERVEATTLHVRLNTQGGDAFDGITMYNALRAHPAKVIIHVDGLAASAGSIIAMAGDEIRMADNAFLMIHNAWGGVMGEADDMRGYAEMLDKLDDSIAATYQVRAGKTRAYWRKKMAEESWFNAAEAKDEGLADVIDKPEKAATNRFDFKIYNHAPDAARELWARQQQSKSQSPDDSMRIEPSSAQPQEVPAMAETTTQAAPAQNPAPASNGNPQGENINLGAFTNAADAIKHFQTVAGPQFYNQGRAKGVEEGAKAAQDRLKAIADVCPGRPAMALTAFLNGQSPDAVKLAVDEAARVEGEAKAAEQAHQIEIARLNTLLSIGGHPGVAMSMAGNDLDSPTGMEPKAQATYEWDHKPAVRNGFSSKENYVNVRVAELTGKFRTQKAG